MNAAVISDPLAGRTVAVAGVGALAEPVRRGPRYASTVALALIGLIVGVDALRAAIAPVMDVIKAVLAGLAAFALAAALLILLLVAFVMST